MTTTKLLISTAMMATLVFVSGCEKVRPKVTPIQQQLDSAMMNNTITTPVLLTSPPPPKAGSLWRPGSNHFFKDSRANAVGDIVTVVISESTDATTEANTAVTRTHNQESGIGNILRTTAGAITNPGVTTAATNLVNTDSNRSFTGDGSTERSDELTGKVAAVVTQVLPNGYMVIQGKREVVVNYELQELNVQGIVRPEDITADNTIMSEKIAEARIFYAGRGIVDESQTPSYGVRFMDKVLPF